MERNYNNLEIYHLSYDFVLHIYQMTNQFPEAEERNIKSQLRRAAVSLPLNIAEGSAKSSPREFTHYLNISYGSAKEIEVLLKLCKDFKYFNDEEYILLMEKLDYFNSKLFLFLRNMEARIPNLKHRFFREFKQNNGK